MDETKCPTCGAECAVVNDIMNDEEALECSNGSCVWYGIMQYPSEQPSE